LVVAEIEAAATLDLRCHYWHLKYY